MKNPFEYGGVVREESFCNRKKELADLNRVFENAEKLFLYSERRIGKTSLLKLALHKLSKDAFIPTYVDLWPTNSEADFAIVMAKAVSEATATTAQKLVELTKNFFAVLQPAVTIDEEGKPKVVFGVTRDNVTGPNVDEVLDALPKLAAKSKKRLLVVFDEFQQIAEYGNDMMVERRIRSAVQHHQDIAYVFLGSKKHLIQQMFLDKARPLYRSAAHYPLGPIAEDDWLPFIKRKFYESRKVISDAQIQRLVEFTGGHPFYTQHLCHALWELTDTDTSVKDDTLGGAVDMLLKRESYAFTTLWDSLAGNQKILLAGIANAQGSLKPFASDFIKQSGMRTPSNVQRAAEALLNKDLIDRDESGFFLITDQFLKLWIQRFTAH